MKKFYFNCTKSYHGENKQDILSFPKKVYNKYSTNFKHCVMKSTKIYFVITQIRKLVHVKVNILTISKINMKNMKSS